MCSASGGTARTVWKLESGVDNEHSGAIVRREATRTGAIDSIFASCPIQQSKAHSKHRTKYHKLLLGYTMLSAYTGCSQATYDRSRIGSPLTLSTCLFTATKRECHQTLHQSFYWMASQVLSWPVGLPNPSNQVQYRVHPTIDRRLSPLTASWK